MSKWQKPQQPRQQPQPYFEFSLDLPIARIISAPYLVVNPTNLLLGLKPRICVRVLPHQASSTQVSPCSFGSLFSFLSFVPWFRRSSPPPKTPQEISVSSRAKATSASSHNPASSFTTLRNRATPSRPVARTSGSTRTISTLSGRKFPVTAI